MEVKRRTARTLVNRLVSADEPLAALSEIRLLSKHDPEIRAPLADAGAVPLLARHLSSGGAADLEENAAAALHNLSISSRESLMSTPGLLDSLSAALRSASASHHAAATLYSLLSVDAYRPIIGSKRPLLSALISLLRPGRSVKDPLRALFGVSLYPLNRNIMVELGAVPALFSLIVKDGRHSGVVEDATAVVAQVAGCYESVDAFRRVAGVRVLVDLVDAGNGASGRARENAAAALLGLAMCGGDKAMGDIREVEGAEAAVAELAERGSERAKEKAEALLRVMESSRRGVLRGHRIEDLYPLSSSSSVG